LAARKIFVRRADGRGRDRGDLGPFDDIQPAWSPDGNDWPFVRAREPGRKIEPGDVFAAFWGGDVWTMDRRSGEASRLVEDAYNPRFSPDGGSIAVDAPWAGQRRASGWSTCTAAIRKQLTSDSSEAIAHVRPRWSPDGRTSCFQA
jgi:Tol biopolymer transport system component